MVRRFALSSLVVLVFLALVALLSLAAYRLAYSSLEQTAILVFVSIWVSAVALGSLLVFAAALRKIWFFPGKGEAVPLESLHQQLLAVNATDGPVWARQKGKTITITWRYDQTQWCELLSRQGINQLYELRCRFDAATYTVTLIDRKRTASFIICPGTIKIGAARPVFPVLWLRMRQLSTVAWYTTAEPYDYAFRAREIKGPVMGTSLNAGWRVRFGLF